MAEPATRLMASNKRFGMPSMVTLGSSHTCIRLIQRCINVVEKIQVGIADITGLTTAELANGSSPMMTSAPIA